MANNSTNINLTLPDTGEFPGLWAPPINANFVILDALFGISGHSHTGSSGDGPRIAHSNLLEIGSNSHALIDAHIANTGLHSDISIGAIGYVNNDQLVASYLNVSDLRFANCLVEQLSSGIVQITPDASAVIPSQVDTAPVVFFDAFTGNLSTTLGAQNWVVNKHTPSGAEYAIKAPSGLYMATGSASSVAGFCTNLISAVTPHSFVQRVAVTIEDKYGPITPQVTDRWSLWLHLLGSERAAQTLTVNSPIEAGLSFALEVQNVSGSLRLVPRIVATRFNSVVTYSGSISGPSGWVHPTSGSVWNNLPITYLIGTHEFSLSLLGESATEFTLSYYYNGGLIFSREFTSADGEFYTTVFEIIEDLQTATSPRVTDYGKFGFSTTYSLTAASLAEFNVKTFAASSTGEQRAPRIVSVPTTSTGPITTAVCQNTNSGDWLNVVIPGYFDIDGTGTVPSNQWEVFANVGATTLLSESFTVRNTANTSEQRGIFCGTPVAATGLPATCLRSLTRQVLPVHGRNLPLPEYSTIVFKAASANIPIEWSSGGLSTSFYSIGDVLPSTFVQTSSLVSRISSVYGHTLELEAIPGTRLPWNALLTVEVTPQYQSDVDYKAVFTSAWKVCAAQPVIQQTIVYKFVPPTNTWSPVGEGNPVQEGDTIFVCVAGRGIPLGPSFWASGNGLDDDYGIASTTGTVGQALAVLSDPIRPFSLFYSLISGGRLDPAIAVTGVPPTVAIASSADPGVGYGVITSTTQEHVVFIGRIHHDAWKLGSPVGISLSMRDTETPAQLASVEVIQATWIQPKPPSIVLAESSISSTSSGATGVTLVVRVAYGDRDSTLTLTSGFSAATVLTQVSAGVSISSSGEYTTWTVTGLTLSAVATTPITVTLTNVAAAQNVAATLGTINGTFNQTPSVSYISGTCVEDAVSTITLQAVTSTLEPGSYLTVDAAFFTIESNVLGPDVAGNRTWTVNIRTTDPVGGPSLPGTMSIVVHNPLAVTTFSVVGIPTQAAVAPTITRVDLDSQLSGVTNWSVGAIGETRNLYVTINDTSPAKLSRIQATSLTGSVEVVFGSFAYVEGSGNVYVVPVTLTAGSVDDTFGVFVANATAGDPLNDTLIPAVTLVASVAVSGFSFLTPVNEGHYFEFSLSGSFDTGGEDLILDFVDGSGATLLTATPVLTTATSTVIAGSARILDNKSGSPVIIYLEVDNTAIIVEVFTNTTVGTPPTPTISSFVLSPNTEGSVGTQVTITGNNLIPPTPPAGRTALAYSYTFTNTGVIPVVVSPVLQAGATANTIRFMCNLATGTAGQRVGININYLGGNTAVFTNQALILASTTAPPVITDISFGDVEEIEYGTSVGVTLTGTGFSAGNVGTSDGTCPVQLSVIGYENAGVANLKESPPGQGINSDYYRSLITDGTIEVQSDTTIVAKFVFPKSLVDTRLRVHLKRPSGHVLGAGEWSQGTIDGITPSDSYHSGLTFDGPVASSELKVNPYPAQGTTRLDSARAFQNWLATSPSGASSLVIVFDRISPKPPTVVALPDSMYPTAVLTNISVAAVGGNPFAFTISFTLPTGDSLDDYPGGVLSPVIPVTLGLQLSSGIPIVSGVYGKNSWSSPAQEQSYHVPLVP